MCVDLNKLERETNLRKITVIISKDVLRRKKEKRRTLQMSSSSTPTPTQFQNNKKTNKNTEILIIGIIDFNFRFLENFKVQGKMHFFYWEKKIGYFINRYRGYHIRLYHLVIGWHTLECNIWFWVRSYKSVTFGLLLNHIRLQHFTCKII